MSMVEALQGYRSEQMTSVNVIQPHSRFNFLERDRKTCFRRSSGRDGDIGTV